MDSSGKLWQVRMFDAKSDVNRYLADHPPLVDVRRRSEEKGPEVRRSSRKKKEEIEREEMERMETYLSPNSGCAGAGIIKTMGW